MGRRKGSITKMAQRPSTTEGIAASSSTITPSSCRNRRGIRFSVMKIAVPTPSGTAINNDRMDVTIVP